VRRVLFALSVAVVTLVAGACAQASPQATQPPASTATPTVPPATARPTGTTASTSPAPPGAPAGAAYDNTLATQACGLLAPNEISAQFGAPTEPGVPIDPYCWWKIGADAFVSLTIFDQRPLSTFRAYSGLVIGDVPDVGDGAFFASNKTLFFGVGPTTYNVQFERGAEWVDSNRPRLVALAHLVLDRLGYIPKPKPTTTLPPLPIDPSLPPPPPTAPTTVAPTTTTTRPKPPPVSPPTSTARPSLPIAVGRPLTAEDPLHIWVGGDSIAAGPAWAVGEAGRATGKAVVDSEFQVGTGLSRPDFFDWYRHLAAVADARDPDVMILLFGGNDIQPLDVPGGGSVNYGDPAWLVEYRARVARIMDDLAVRGRRVIWVGTPAMEEPEYNAQMAALNEVYSSEAAARDPWVSYFDAWTMFSPPGEPGVFTRELPDEGGVLQPVRFDDIHYDIRGSELLAAALLDRVRRFSGL
jgi:hypothetical protein